MITEFVSLAVLLAGVALLWVWKGPLFMAGVLVALILGLFIFLAIKHLF
jgi:hypothetical protein